MFKGDCVFCQVYYDDNNEKVVGNEIQQQQQQQVGVVQEEEQQFQQKQEPADDINMITASNSTNSVSNSIISLDGYGATMAQVYKEPTLLSASKYPLFNVEDADVSLCCSHSNYIEVGLSKALYFEPIVTVSCVNTCCRMGKIIFTQKQWHSFMCSRIEFYCRKFFESWITEPVAEEEHTLEVDWCSEQIKIIFRNVLQGDKTVTIKNSYGYAVVLSYRQFINLCSLTSLIVHKLDVLESQKFYDFYYSFVRIQSGLLKVNPNTDIIFSAKMLCETVPSEHYYLIREMLTFFPHDFIADVKSRAEL